MKRNKNFWPYNIEGYFDLWDLEDLINELYNENKISNNLKKAALHNASSLWQICNWKKEIATKFLLEIEKQKLTAQEIVKRAQDWRSLSFGKTIVENKKVNNARKG